MKTQISISLCAALTALTALANREILNEKEMILRANLDALRWKASLSIEDITFIGMALSAPKDEIAGSALVVALVHDLDNLSRLLQSAVGPTNGSSRQLANSVLIGMKRDESLRACLRSIALSSKDSTWLEDIETVGHLATRAVVIGQARELRNNKRGEPETNGLSLTFFDTELLRYSQMPNARAISNIIERVRSAEIADTETSALTDTLSSYGDEGDEAALQALEDSGRTSKYGKVVLLRYLAVRALLMSEPEKQQLRSVVRALDRSDRAIGSACENLEYRLDRLEGPNAR